MESSEELTKPPSPQPLRRRRRWFWGAVAIIVAAGGIVLWNYDPRESAFYPPCLFRQMTGLHCPGCGGTRAMYSLLHGDLASAFALNPLLVLSIPFVAIIALFPAIRAHRWTPGIVILVLVLYGIARNLPGFLMLPPVEA